MRNNRIPVIRKQQLACPDRNNPPTIINNYFQIYGDNNRIAGRDIEIVSKGADNALLATIAQQAGAISTLLKISERQAAEIARLQEALLTLKSK